MRRAYAGILGGLAAGLAMSLAMVAERQAGMPHRTLAGDAEDWLDRVAHTRRRIGPAGTTALEQANHMAAAGAFGCAYSMLREHSHHLPAWALGALYGAGLYLVNIAGIAPLIGLTEGEWKAQAPVRAERFILHVLYGVITAAVTETLTSGGVRGRSGS